MVPPRRIYAVRDYAKARMYDPELRRFHAEDPIKDGLNWYASVFKIIDEVMI